MRPDCRPAPCDRNRAIGRNNVQDGGKLSASTSNSFQENGINPYIWCVVGGLLGGAAGLIFKSGDRIVIIENVLVGIFGAYIGGDFIASMLNGGVINDKDFSMRSLGLAIGGAVVCLALLRLMRSTVGPMRAGKSKRRP